MQTLVYSSMYPGDVNFLDTPETYLEKLGAPKNITPRERLIMLEQARTALYSFDAQIIPRVTEKILFSDMATDQEARALWIAFAHHAMDPAFVKILMEYLACVSNLTLNGMVGALLSRVLEKFFQEHAPKDEKKKDEETEKIDCHDVEHIQAAMESLLGETATKIQYKFRGLSHPEALYITACLAMNSKATLTELIKSDLPITADIFKEIEDPDKLVEGSLLLLKADIPSKPTKTQSAFLESLKRWVFMQLNDIPGGQAVCYQYLVGVYKSVKPDVSPYYIQIKDCGPSYPNLIQAAKQIVNK